MSRDKTISRYDGGCLCGLIRYRIEGSLAPAGAGYCHCRLCQHSSGAPVIAWATFYRSDMQFVAGAPAVFRSSPKGARQFCAACGTLLAFAYTDGPDEIDVTIASLDYPESVVPTYHLWTSSQISWFQLDDELLCYPDDGHDYSPYKQGVGLGPPKCQGQSTIEEVRQRCSSLSEKPSPTRTGPRRIIPS